VESSGDDTFQAYLSDDPAVDLPDDPRLSLCRLPRGAAPFATYWQQVVLSRELERQRPDVLFAPADAIPLGFGGPTLVTVHDLSYFAHPEWFDFRQGARRRWLTRRSMSAATRIVAVSEFTRSELIRRLDVPRDKIEVIPHGRDPRLDGVVPTAEAELRARLRQTGPFALVVGSIFERRRTGVVLDAFRQLEDLGIGLVLAGADRRRRAGDMHEEISSRGLDGRVTWIDYCSEPDLVGLYRIAHHLIYVSSYEGFGLPPLEGMGFGLPAIVSGCEALKEVYADSALVVPTVDADSIAGSVRSLVTDPERREELVRRGRRRAEALDAAATAERTLEQLRGVAVRR
jgi:alpha-1,3-rhamnosyl/mannosyltransferase